MDKDNSPAKALKKLERYVYNLKAAKELNTLERGEREAMIAMRDHISGARFQIEAYLNDDDTRSQIALLNLGIEELVSLRDSILLASQYNLLGPADVAEFSAMTEQLIEQLR